MLHDSSTDISANESFDTFSLMQELTQNTSYYIRYEVTTTSGLTIGQTYKLAAKQNVLPELKATLTTELNQENGYVKISLIGDEDENGYERTATGFFLLTRRKENEPGKWEELLKFMIQGHRPSSWSWKDFTIEQGINYIYSVQQYSDTLYSQRILSCIKMFDAKGNPHWVESPIYADFEHAFLFDGERQLKIKYNPQVSSFKTTLQETKVDTLGSKHPFIFKNGHVSYKDFPISGLISYLMDEEKLFINNDIYDFSTENLVRGQEGSSIISKGLKNRTTDLTADNVFKERDFKLNVLNWLNNGKPKLFRSPTEGNYIVRLMNNSLSPNTTVGRMLHTFSSNAYEVADFNYDNLIKYKFIDNTEREDFIGKTITQWSSIEVFNAMSETTFDKNKWSKNLLNNRIALEMDIVGMFPGDKILITYVGEKTSHEIVIGATGAYKVANIASISAIKLHQNNMIGNGVITYSFETQYDKAFGLYHDATIKDVPAQQFFGHKVIGKNIMSLLEDLKTSILNVYYLRFEKRPVYMVYADAGSSIQVDANLNIDLSTADLYFDRYKTDAVTADKLDTYAVYQIHLNAMDKTAEIERNQDYYLDNNLNTFFPKEGSYLCLNENKKSFTIYSDTQNFTRVFIDPEVKEYEEIEPQLKELGGIDLRDTEDYYLEEYRPKQLFIGPGVVMTIGYYASFVTYNFEKQSKYTSCSLKNKYDKAVAAYEKLLVPGSTATSAEIENARKDVNKKYNNLLAQLGTDLDNYKKEFGLV